MLLEQPPVVVSRAWTQAGALGNPGRGVLRELDFAALGIGPLARRQRPGSALEGPPGRTPGRHRARCADRSGRQCRVPWAMRCQRFGSRWRASAPDSKQGHEHQRGELGYVTICEFNTALCSDRARGPGRAQMRGWHGGRPVPIVAALRLFGPDVRVDRIRARLISAPGLVSALRAPSGPSGPAARYRFWNWFPVAEVAEVQARHADRLDRVRPGPRSLSLSIVRRRFVLPAQDENGDVVSRVLATDQGSHHRDADILRRPG